MGLLDSVLGMAQQAMTQNQGGSVSGSPDLIKAAIGLLSGDSSSGGLSGLVQAFSKAGLGEVAQSWVGTGSNLPVSGAQLMSVLGSLGGLGKIAQQLGLTEADAAQQLSQVLPDLVDKATPDGKLPEGGLGSLAELATKFLSSRA